MVIARPLDPKRTSLARMRIAAQMWWARTLRRNRFHSDASSRSRVMTSRRWADEYGSPRNLRRRFPFAMVGERDRHEHVHAAQQTPGFPGDRENDVTMIFFHGTLKRFRNANHQGPVVAAFPGANACGRRAQSRIQLPPHSSR